MKKLLLVFGIIIFAVSAKSEEISLNGTWSFAIDPTNVGEQNGWHQPWEIAKDNVSLLPSGWDQVTVPHCWSLDTRYNFIGKAWTQVKVVQEDTLSAANTVLWDFDNPNLYDVTSSLLSDNKEIYSYMTYFGIREFKPVGTHLLLNGKPVRVAGANRHSDHPEYGSTDPAELASLDMGLQRNGNMVMARLCHTPTSKHFFRWADENGSLIFAEIPGWGFSTVLLGNSTLREKFKAQMTEMVEAFWNSPSIVAWSTGNEYQSWTPEGDDWTLFQREKYLELDTTRLITFMALGSAGNVQNLLPPHDSYRHIVKEYPLPVLNPGESATIRMARPSAAASISVVNAGGFKVFDSGVKK